MDNEEITVTIRTAANFPDERKITVEKWDGSETYTTTINWREIVGAYHEMRLAMIDGCPDCHSPKDIFDAGAYCKRHAHLEKLDDTIAELFLP